MCLHLIELNINLHLDCHMSSAEPQITSEERMGPCTTVSALFLRGGNDVFLWFNIAIFHVSH